jgi:hypothetical protein
MIPFTVRKKELKKMLCAHCMKVWRENGADPEKKPKGFLPNELDGGRCPSCKNIFRAHFAAL